MFKRLIAFAARPGVRRYTENVSWMFFARVFTMGVSFLTTLYIARALGPTNFGELDYALAIISVFSPLAAFGLINVLQRELIKNPEKRNELTGTAFILNLGFAFLATLLVILFALTFHVEYLAQVLIIILSTTYVLGTFQLLQQDFYARAASKVPSLITMGVWTMTSIGKVLVLMEGKGIIWLALVTVGEQLLYAIALTYVYKRYAQGTMRLWKFSPEHVPLFLKTGAAIALVGFFSLVYARIDQVFIRNMIDARALGLYSSGVRLVELWNILPALVLSGLYPALVQAHETSPSLYKSRMRKIFLVLLVSSIGISLFLFVAAPLLMKTIFGPEFVDGIPSLRIYSWSIIGTFLGQYVMNILFTDDYRKVLIATNIIPALINIGLNLWLIPIAGIVGAAYATVIAYSITPLTPFLFPSSRKRILKTL